MLGRKYAIIHKKKTDGQTSGHTDRKLAGKIEGSSMKKD
jgi:hypothetical protein